MMKRRFEKEYGQSGMHGNPTISNAPSQQDRLNFRNATCELKYGLIEAVHAHEGKRML